MDIKVHDIKYCPRCDKSFMFSSFSIEYAEKKSLIMLTEHIERAHPEYIETWGDINDQSFVDTTLKGYTPETGNGSL